MENESSRIKKMETSACLQFLGENYIGRLAYNFAGYPHIIPITYFHDAEEKCILAYSSPGFKIDAMEEQTKVAFQVDDISSLEQWRSVLIHGNFEKLEGSTAKKHLHRFAEGVQHTISQKKGKEPRFLKDLSSRSRETGIPIVYRIHIAGIVGKFRVSVSSEQ